MVAVAAAKFETLASTRNSLAPLRVRGSKIKTKKTCQKNKNCYLNTMSEKIKLWDVQEKVNGGWISIYGSPFESWDEAKNVFDEALMSQEKMSLHEWNPLRLIAVDEE